MYFIFYEKKKLFSIIQRLFLRPTEDVDFNNFFLNTNGKSGFFSKNIFR